MPFVFVVDDDEDIRDFLKIWFTKRKYEVETFNSGKNLIEEVNNKKPDLIMMDIRLQGQSGLNISRDIKEHAKHPVKIILASGDPAALLSYQYAYADGIIHKPFLLSELEGKIRKLLNLSK